MKINRNGLSLINVLIMMSAIAITIPVLLSSLTDSNKRAASRANYQKYIYFVQSMKEKLQDPKICSDLLRNVIVSRNKNATVNIALNTDFGNTKGPIRKDWKLSGESFTLDRVFIQASGDDFNDVRPWGSAAHLDTVPFRVFFIPKDVTIDITSLNSAFKFPFRNKKGVVTKTINFIPPETISPMKLEELQITILANLAGNRIQTCFGPSTAAASCESIGGVYDPYETNSSLRCKPDKICFNSMKGLVNNKSQCTAPYNNAIQHVGVINGQNKYICSWCHEP